MEDNSDLVVFPDGTHIKLTKEQKERLASCPKLTQFQRQKLEKDSKKNWDLFYKRNGDRFFKNRHWTRREFPELYEDLKDESEYTRKLLEIGCGCGDFALPLLEEDVDSRPRNLSIFCCDISERAIEVIRSKPKYIRHHPTRMKAFVADITKDLERIRAEIGGQVDFVSLIFVLSALDPDISLKQAIDNIYSVLKPQGVILFRDYAIYDEAMMRFGENSKISDNFYVRQDGTRAHFFTKDELVKLFCNFKCESINYVKRETINNATKEMFSRIFLQAKFRK